MKTWIRRFYGIRTTAMVVGLTLMPGCWQNTQGLFTMPSLPDCNYLAVLGLTEEQGQIFMAAYMKTFADQDITFVERGRLQQIISEQDLLQGRLNDRTRAQIKEILGVEALVLCAYYDAKEGSVQKKLRVRVVDSDTGAIVGSVITQASDNFNYHSYTAVRALKADLNGSYQGGYQARSEYSNRH